MGRVLFFDAFNGVSGDMILGALIDLGLPLEHLEAELAKLGLSGYRLRAEPVERQGLWGRNFRVVLDEAEPADHAHHHHHDHDHHHPHEHDHGAEDHHHHDHVHHGHHHHHGEDEAADAHGSGHHHHREPGPSDPSGPTADGGAHHHRTWRAIRRLIQESGLSPEVREQSLRIFERLARAEATVHRSPLDDVHFHEVGAIDSIVDIVGACIGFHYFRIESFHAAALNLGGGTVTFSHGTWPVPAPATVELVRGFPTRLSETPFELTTPTGAAIVTALVDPARPAPPMSIEASGFGAGDREIRGIPNMLRLLLGDGDQPAVESSTVGVVEEQVVLLEANLDNLDPETTGHFMDRALQEGALDVWFAPVQMKKNRPAVLVSVLCRSADRERMLRLFFQETSTLGVRGRLMDRWALPRREQRVDTEFGPVRFKLGELDGRTIHAAPEYEDLKKISADTGLPLKEVRKRVTARFD